MSDDVDVYPPDLPLHAVVARRYRIDAPPLEAHIPAVAAFARTDPVEGWLVGASDGHQWGWWGPVPKGIAEVVRPLFAAAATTESLPPGEWARRLRRATRHASSGLLAVAAGCIELACWDLLGWRERSSVRVIAGGSGPGIVDSYATCFGIALDGEAAAEVAREVAGRWTVQKWRPSRSVAATNRLAEAAGGAGALALDFGGLWAFEAIADLCASLAFELAWIEEPFPPDEMHRAAGQPLPAPHAAGEHCYSRAEVAILEAAGVDIWQPDPAFCGGFEAFREVIRRAAEVKARCMPHGGGLLPALHAVAAGAEVEAVEYHLLLEPRRQAHLASPVLIGHGTRLVAPDGPGWAGPLHPDLQFGATV